MAIVMPHELEERFNDVTAEALGLSVEDIAEGLPEMTVEQQLAVLSAQIDAVHDATKAIASSLRVMFR